MMASASTSGGGARPWRTALLTLRDESLSSPSPTALLELLRRVLLTPASASASLAASAAALSPHEVGSDVAFLADTAAAAASCPGSDDVLRGVCHLIYDVMCKTNMEIDSSGWLAMLKFLDTLVKCSIEGACVKGLSSRTAALNTTSECLHILRFWSRDYGRSISLTESSHSLTVLVSIVSCLQAELNISDKPANATGISSRNSGSVNTKNSNIWDMKISAFSMVEDILSKVASNMTENLWQSVIEVLRKVMDFVAARNLVIESSIMSRFYTSFLRCLHLVLADPKGPLSGHVAGFVANLQIFFVYGLRSSPPPTLAPKETRTDSKPRASRGRYRPPHLRNKDGGENDSLEGRNSDSEYSRYDISSSDSDLSDSDGYAKSGDRFRSSKARLAAILCIQDICRADPKLLTSQWPVLLPENDVLQQRKYQATLMTCLLFDPITKVRVEAASTIATMLEGQALVLTQVAEYKESSKRGSFTTLSSSLGQILMQLHTGALYLIQRETQATLLAALFRVLILLISATPYTRMPKELLPTVIKVLCSKLLDRHSNKTEHYALLVNVLSCLETAFSKVPPTLDVFVVLTEDCCAGPSHDQEESNVIAILLHCIEEEMHYSVRHGAFQVLRSAVHNYPSCANLIWEKLRDNVLNLLQIESFEDQKYDANFGPPGPKEESSIKGRCLVAGIKVMDECLRVSSGFKGADDIKECRLLDIQQISDCTINKTIKSAPHFEMEAAGSSQNCTLDITLGTSRWIEVIETHLPQGLSHGSAMVRTASLTCFAGMTSDVFFSMPENKRDYVTSSAVHAALNDTVPSVRSAACRAIGIVACFPQILSSSSLPGKFIDAIEFNTHNSSTPVRVTAAWALANLCSCIRFRALEVHTDPYAGVLNKSSISLLVEVALRLAKDSEKVKSNAVRALGYLSRFIRFNYQAGTINDPSDSVFYGDPVWLERMVQALVSCVTTGNVKDICRADPKLLTSQWPVLLPENDVLQQRKYQATLMTCLLFDPITKVRVEAASTIATMLEGQALVLTQVAEYKESSKRGSFTTLSSSLGQILMQLHTGALYLIQRETQATLLAALFRVLILLISATPYTRMPKELLPTVIKVLCSKLLDRHSNKTEHYALLVNVLSCLETAFSKVPPTLDVFVVLTEDCCAGPSHDQEESNVIAILLHCIEEEMHYSVRHGAFQVLRSAVHNYPSCANLIWEKLRDNVLNLLQIESFEDQKYDANFGPPGPKEESSIKGRCLVAGIKVMDECLRVSSGFKGADDIKECRLLDIQQISDCTINKTIKSAPHFEMEAAGSSQNCTLDITLGTSRWIEVIETHLPQGLSHGSAMVRTASLTCFAGMTSDVFFSMPENKRDYVTSSAVHAALNDTVPSVRSAACRAIGIVACFPQILSSSSLPGKFIDAIEFNTHNSSTPVRVTAAWALANLCSCIRFRALEVHTDPYAGVLNKSSISLLVEVALRLAKDSEKVKSNAVRALGYLSRFIRFNYQAGTINDPSDSVFYGDPVWLERMVQALVSCVTTGNVKVQWNVCHALSNLFMNDTLRLQDMPWASSVYSILLLLIRDSNNYKIKMHAAVALAVPVSRLDYGSSFPDVVRGLVHALESLNSNNSSLPSNFKQKDNLEKQLTFTALHLLSFVSPNDDPSLKDFLMRKASFLEDWLKSLCTSFNNSEHQPLATEAINDEDGFSPNVTQKSMLSSALQSLLGIYTGRNQQAITQRFEQLARGIA